MSEHTHDSECELYSEACGCDFRHALKQQCDELAEALEAFIAAERGHGWRDCATGTQERVAIDKARAALAKHLQPQEAPELFPGTLEKLRGLGK